MFLLWKKRCSALTGPGPARQSPDRENIWPVQICQIIQAGRGWKWKPVATGKYNQLKLARLPKRYNIRFVKSMSHLSPAGQSLIARSGSFSDDAAFIKQSAHWHKPVQAPCLPQGQRSPCDWDKQRCPTSFLTVNTAPVHGLHHL